MFSKAKIKRFNEEMSCAPPPTKYDPKVLNKSGGCSIDRSKRWQEKKEQTPGPYLGPVVPKDLSDLTPFKKNWKKNSACFNSSISSSASASSQSGFLSPPKPFGRSRSFKSAKSKGLECKELLSEVKDLTNEKKEMKSYIEKLEQELAILNVTHEIPNSEDKDRKNFAEIGIQINIKDTPIKSSGTSPVPESTDEPQDLSCPKKENFAKISYEELQLLRDQIHHLTVLRDNLEASVAGKDDTIMDLQMQVDIIAADSQKNQNDKEALEVVLEEARKKLERNLEEQRIRDSHVKDLIAKYEAFSKEREVWTLTKDGLAQKDIEIELLNDSIATLNIQIREYERMISRIQLEANSNRSQIFSLERTVSDLSIASKGKECVESILEDEIQERSKEVSKLEATLKEIQTKLKEIEEDREQLQKQLEEEKSNVAESNKKIESFEVTLKEKEVLEQFFEKELASRESEVSESNKKLQEVEMELEITRRVALDLQQEAETQLNQIFSLQASLNAKDYDIESKEELIISLKDEVNQKNCLSLDLQEKFDASQKIHSELVEENQKKGEKMEFLEENISQLKSALDKEEENNSKLEERIVQLILENEECEKEHKRRLLEKESEIEELSVKYSDALLEQESTKRILSVTSEKLEKENLLKQAIEKELDILQDDLDRITDSHSELESSTKELTHKLIHIEDALSCEEAESRDLQKKLESSENRLQTLENENQILHSANEGYAGQISVLKVDMVKKSVAVEDMQKRIDELRDEKNALLEEKKNMEEEMSVMQTTLQLLGNTISEKETVLKDLQNEFEEGLQTISKLKEEVEKKNFGIEELQKIIVEKNKDEELRVIEFEEEKSEFFNQISLLENHLKEEQAHAYHYKTQAIEMEDKANTIEEEKHRAISSLQTQVKNEKAKVESLEEKLTKLQMKYEGYEDQLNNMQTSLIDKTAEVEKWNQSYIEANLCSETYKDKVEELKKEISRLVEESEQLNKSLVSQETLLASLNDSVSAKIDEIQSLTKNLEEKQNKLGSLEKCMEEMDKTISQLMKERDNAVVQVLHLQHSLDLTKEEIKNKISTFESKFEDKMKKLIADYEEKIENLTKKQEQLSNESEMWHSKCQHLENIIEPFREQLSAYEVEKNLLLSKNEATEIENKRLSEQYANLIGHNNHKQKIQHLVKLKSENNDLRERVIKLQVELEKQRKTVRKLEEKEHKGPKWGKSFVVSKSKAVVMDKVDKENASPVEEGLDPQATSTPLQSSSLANRNRRI